MAITRKLPPLTELRAFVHRPSHPKLGAIKAFIEWARSAAAA
jgi:hypothetical protein